MASGAIVPWTDPGGTPCCCGDVCGSSALNPFAGNPYQRIDLTAEEYSAIRAGAGLTYTITAVFSGINPDNSSIVSQSPSPYFRSVAFTFPLLSGERQCANNLSLGFGQSTVNLIGANATSWLFAISYNFTVICQDAGQGSLTDAPLAQPAIYLFGQAMQLIGPLSSVIFVWDASGDTIGTSFGQSISAAKTQSRVDASLTATLELSAP